MTATPARDLPTAPAPAPTQSPRPGRILHRLIAINALLCATLLLGDPLFTSYCHRWLCEAFAPFRLGALLLYWLLSGVSCLTALRVERTLTAAQRAHPSIDRLHGALFWHGAAWLATSAFWIRALVILGG